MPWKLHNFITQRLLEPTERKDTLSNPIVKIAVGGIALGLAVMLLTVSMVKGFEHEVQQRIIRFGSAITLEPAVLSHTGSRLYKMELCVWVCHLIFKDPI
ncbi:MAG: hypothetical protein ACO259_09105 [Bacteroidia bacterium]